MTVRKDNSGVLVYIYTKFVTKYTWWDQVGLTVTSPRFVQWVFWKAIKGQFKGKSLSNRWDHTDGYCVCPFKNRFYVFTVFT